MTSFLLTDTGIGSRTLQRFSSCEEDHKTVREEDHKTVREEDHKTVREEDHKTVREEDHKTLIETLQNKMCL